MPDHLHTIRDLAAHVARLLELNLRGGNTEPPQFFLSGFLVPHAEELREVLRDDEVVDVEPSDGSVTSLAFPALAPGPPQALTAAAGEKRAHAALTNTAVTEVAPVKKSKQAVGVGAAAMMAIGDAGRQVSALKANDAAETPRGKGPMPKAVPPSSSSSSSDDSDTGDGGKATAASAHAKGRGGGQGASFGGGRGRGAALGEDASRAAQAAALATCAAAGGANVTGDDTGCGLFVGGLTPRTDDAMLRSHFQYYGAVESAEVVINQKTGKSKGYAFVDFKHAKSRDKVIADGPGQEIDGKSVEVKPRIKGGIKGGKTGKSKGKGKDGPGGGGKGSKAKGGRESLEGNQAPGRPRHAAAGRDDDEDDEGAGAEVIEKKGRKPKQTSADPVQLSEDQVEIERQMAALGLPCSFTASAGKDDEDESDDEEDEVADDDE